MREEKQTSFESDQAASTAENIRKLQSLRNIRAAEFASLETEFKRALTLEKETSQTVLASIQSELKCQFEKVNNVNGKNYLCAKRRRDRKGDPMVS